MRGVVHAILLCGLAAGTHAGLVEASSPGVSVTTVLRTSTTLTGQAIQFPRARGSVVAFFVRQGPGGQTRWHKVLATQVVYVLQGSMRLEIPGQSPRTFPTGAALVSPVGVTLKNLNAGGGNHWVLVTNVFEQGQPEDQSVSGDPIDTEGLGGFKTTTTLGGQPLVFPPGPHHVLMAQMRLASGAVDAQHRHSGPTAVVVLEGQVTIRLPNGPTRVFSTGEGGVEPAGWHSLANTGPGSATVALTRFGRPNEPLLIRP